MVGKRLYGTQRWQQTVPNLVVRNLAVSIGMLVASKQLIYVLCIDSSPPVSVRSSPSPAGLVV